MLFVQGGAGLGRPLAEAQGRVLGVMSEPKVIVEAIRFVRPDEAVVAFRLGHPLGMFGLHEGRAVRVAEHGECREGRSAPCWLAAERNARTRERSSDRIRLGLCRHPRSRMSTHRRGLRRRPGRVHIEPSEYGVVVQHNVGQRRNVGPIDHACEGVDDAGP